MRYLTTLQSLWMVIEDGLRTRKLIKLMVIKGIEIAKNIAIESHKIGIKNLTLYAFSFQNWNRPKIEVESLFKLFNDLFEDKSKFFKDNGFVFNPIGRLDELNNLMREKDI